MAMTLDEFRATGSVCPDLGEALSDASLEGCQGRLYIDVLYIERVLPHWSETVRRMGGWHLILGNKEWITDDLPRLESLLYEWAAGEGYFAGKEP